MASIIYTQTGYCIGIWYAEVKLVSLCVERQIILFVIIAEIELTVLNFGSIVLLQKVFSFRLQVYKWHLNLYFIATLSETMFALSELALHYFCTL